jgi:hypothetical protein
MTKVLEKNVAEIIVVSVFLLTFLSSCSNTHYLCDAYASKEQKINYSDYISVNLVNSVECENCDEID